MNKNLKTIYVTLIIVLIAVVSFIGIYVKEDFKYVNKIPTYQLTKSLGKTIISNLKIDETVNEVKYDENGNVVEDDQEDTENTNYEVRQEAVNKEEIRTVENYKIAKEIIEKRLKDIGLPEYIVRLDEENGNIQIEYENDVNVDAGTYYAAYVGKAEFKDENNNIILDNNDIKKSEVGYNQTSSGSYQVYLNLTLNNQGQAKIQELKNNKEEQSENTVNENSVDTQNTTVAEENNVAENETSNTTESAETTETSKKAISFYFEDEEIGDVAIDDITSKNQIRVNIEEESSNTTTINNNLNEAAVMAIIINSGKMPIKYQIENSQELVTKLNNNQINIAIYVLIGVFVIISLYQIIKYKKDGIVTVLSNIGIISIFLLLLRYTNVNVGYESFYIAFILEIILAYIDSKILNKIKDVKTVEEAKQGLSKAYKEVIDILVLSVLIAVVFSFVKWAEIASMGMVMFWGIVSIIFGYFVFTRTLLLNNRK